MKRVLSLLFGLGIVAVVGFSNLNAASSDGATDEIVVTSSGTTIITFDRDTQEIYYVRLSTNTVYMDLYAVDCSSNSHTDSLVADSSATGKDALSATVEARTRKMSVWTDDINVNLKIRGRHWE